MFVGFVLFDKPQLYGGAFEVVLFAQLAFHVAAVAPVYKLGGAAKYFECWNGVVGFLGHVVELGVAVFEAGRWVSVDNGAQPTV